MAPFQNACGVETFSHRGSHMCCPLRGCLIVVRQQQGKRCTKSSHRKGACSRQRNGRPQNLMALRMASLYGNGKFWEMHVEGLWVSFCIIRWTKTFMVVKTRIAPTGFKNILVHLQTLHGDIKQNGNWSPMDSPQINILFWIQFFRGLHQQILGYRSKIFPTSAKKYKKIPTADCFGCVGTTQKLCNKTRCGNCPPPLKRRCDRPV